MSKEEFQYLGAAISIFGAILAAKPSISSNKKIGDQCQPIWNGNDDFGEKDLKNARLFSILGVLLAIIGQILAIMG